MNSATSTPKIVRAVAIRVSAVTATHATLNLEKG